MSIRIHSCAPRGKGCKVVLLPDAQDAVEYLREECDKLGWKMGSPQTVDETNLLLFHIEGPSDAEFRASLKNNPMFDFSICK